MAEGVFSYHEGVAATSHDDLGSVILAVDSSLTDLGGFVASAKANWEGDEMELYSGIQAKWAEAAATVREILSSVQQGLGSTTESVSGMRSQVSSALQNS